MGYTNYYRTPNGFTTDEWTKLKGFASILIERCKEQGIALAGWDGEKDTEIEISDDRISFNGLDEDSHETFSLYKEGSDFSFCKTARKPYDTAVVAMLCAVNHFVEGGRSEALEITSDGDVLDWSAGQQLAQDILGEPVDIPHGVANRNFES